MTGRHAADMKRSVERLMTPSRSSARSFDKRWISLRWMGVGLAALALAACSNLPRGGPRLGEIERFGTRQGNVENAPVQLMDVTDTVTRRLREVNAPKSFAALLGEVAPYGAVVGPGDALDIGVWEAPPAVLFGSSIGSIGMGGAEGITTGSNTGLPEQVVNQDGTIIVPFAGTIQAAGRTPEAIAQDIRGRLAGKAHDPQVVVRIVRNATSDVTVVGDVTTSVRMPLTTKGERVLDALASAGGVHQPVGKMTIQITRGGTVVAMPLSAVIKDPRENVRLQASDIVTALFQPYSFTVLGAANRNEEVPFESTGLTLSQALGRIGGVADARANPHGVFIFRFEDPAFFTANGQPSPPTSANGKVPVIYRVDLRNPATLFAAQSFPIHDQDLIYVANSPLADFQKFLTAVSQIVYPIISVQRVINP